MDDLTFSARRASGVTTVRTAEHADPDARSRTLVMSPLRAGILRYLNSRPDEAFDVGTEVEVAQIQGATALVYR